MNKSDQINEVIFLFFPNNPKPNGFISYFKSGCSFYLWDLAPQILVAVKERQCRSHVLSLRGTCLCCLCIPEEFPALNYWEEDLGNPSQEGIGYMKKPVIAGRGCGTCEESPHSSSTHWEASTLPRNHQNRPLWLKGLHLFIDSLSLDLFARWNGVGEAKFFKVLHCLFWESNQPHYC